jgi:predicted  nucleic acid-binding Zn-ribbon protein
MNTVTVIVLGIVVVSIFGVIGDMVTKIMHARINAKNQSTGAAVPRNEIDELNRRIGVLETRLEEREDAVKRLQDEVRFVTKMLEDRTGRT